MTDLTVANLLIRKRDLEAEILHDIYVKAVAFQKETGVGISNIYITMSEITCIGDKYKQYRPGNVHIQLTLEE